MSGDKVRWLLLGHDDLRELQHCFLSVVLHFKKLKSCFKLCISLRQRQVYRVNISYHRYVNTASYIENEKHVEGCPSPLLLAENGF